MAQMTTPLNIVYWNANGINRDKDILIEFLEDHNVDILLINEIHLSINKRFSLKNMQFIVRTVQ